MRSMSSVKFERAVVTGASSGVGEAFARRLVSEGARVTLIARRAERLEALATELGPGEGRPLVADLSTDAGVDAAIEAIDREHPDLLVNCAGFGTRRFFAELDPEVIEAMVRLQSLAPVRLTRAALPAMIEAGHGAVINVSSMAAYFTSSRYTTYSATKAFLNSFSRGLEVELRGTGVSVQSLCLGLTRTEFFHGAHHEGFSYSEVPAWVFQEPDEVVDASLTALGRGPVEVIPGWINKAFVTLMRSPLVAAAVDLTTRKMVNEEQRPW